MYSFSIVHLVYVNIITVVQAITFYRYHSQKILNSEPTTHHQSPKTPKKVLTSQNIGSKASMEQDEIFDDFFSTRKNSTRRKPAIRLKVIQEEDRPHRQQQAKQSQQIRISAKSLNTFTDLEDGRLNTETDATVTQRDNRPLIFFQVLSRLILLQSLIGWWMQVGLHIAISGGLGLTSVQIFRVLQFKDKENQLIEMQLCYLFTLITIFQLQPDLSWSITYLVCLVMQIIIELVKIKYT